ILLGLSTEPVEATEPVALESRLRCEPAGTCCWIAVLGRTGCLGAAVTAEAVARTKTSASANLGLVNMACLRCSVLDPFARTNIPKNAGAFHATGVWFLPDRGIGSATERDLGTYQGISTMGSGSTPPHPLPRRKYRTRHSWNPQIPADWPYPR